MSRNKEIRADRIFMLIFIVILILSVLGFGGYFAINLFKDKLNKPEEIVDPKNNQKEENEKVSIKLNDYTVYIDDSNELGFDFVVCNIDVTTNKDKLSFSLNNLQTSEKISLNDVNKYINKINNSGFDLSRLNIVSNTITSENNEASVNIFVPFEKEDASIKVFNLLDTSKFDISLSKNNVFVTTLKLSTGENIEIDDELNIFVSSCSISTKMLHNGEEYSYPESFPVYTFELVVNNINEDIKIEDAKFIKDKYSNEYECLDDTYSSLMFENILNKDLSIDYSGALFFQIPSDDQYISYDGTLLIKLSNNPNWIKISTELR